MLVLALIQFAYHVLKAYTFTDLNRYFTCRWVQWYKEPLFIELFEHLSYLVTMANYPCFLPAPWIKPGQLAWVECALTIRPHYTQVHIWMEEQKTVQCIHVPVSMWSYFSHNLHTLKLWDLIQNKMEVLK